MQEADEGIIEHSAFDALTLERMLQFIYQGEYTVKAVTSETEDKSHVNGSADAQAETPKFAPPHLRSASTAEVTSETQPEAPKKCPAEHPMAAHVYVYGIAQHYEIPELRDLAMKKFEEAKANFTMTGFMEVVRVAYTYPTSWDYQLRDVLQLYLLNERPDWLTSTVFTSILARHSDLHEFTATTMIAIVK